MDEEYVLILDKNSAPFYDDDGVVMIERVAGKPINASLSFRYNANSDELVELSDMCDDDPPTPQCDASPTLKSETSSPKRTDKTTSILDKYFKSLKTERNEDINKTVENKSTEGNQSPPKDVTSSPMKEYLKSLSKKSVSESTENKEPHTETWKIFHDFKFKITQAVEDMKTRSQQEETKEKSVPRDNSVSDSEENSAVKDSDHSVGDTDNQVSSLNSSIQNLSELTQPATTKPNDSSLPVDTKKNSESSDETHKNLDVSKHNDSSIEVESGIEALEDNFGTFEDTSPLNVYDTDINNLPQIPSSKSLRKSNSSQSSDSIHTSKVALIKFNIQFYILTLLLAVSFAVLSNWTLWNGFLLGLWTFCFFSQLKLWVVENYLSEEDTSKSSLIQMRRSNIPTYTVPSIKEHRPLKKYEGWINHYRFPEYDPYTYHINKTATAFMKLEGTTLRISYTTTKIGKRALWDEKIEKVTFYQHRIYNLIGARVILLPKGLVRRRQWSKKYPICIILSEDEKIQVLEKEGVGQSTPTERRVSESAPEKKKDAPETENMETNTSSPEKKRRFIWRKREKSISHSEVESGREGLRHRLARKIHKEKKLETVSTNTSPTDGVIVVDKLEDVMVSPDLDTEMNVTHTHLISVTDDEELDEAELHKVKELLEEAEGVPDAEGLPDTEWSLHVKHSKEHSHLYLFGRTGREKQEWFRRLSVAISEANTSNVNGGEQPANEEKSVSESEKEREGIELAVYHHHATERECVSLGNKGPSKIQSEVTADGATPPSSQTTPQTSLYDYYAKEESFWSYFLKIVQSKSPSPTCDCRILSADVQWLNMALARIVFDVMNDPATKARMQTKIQKKLQTLKLPSFMSPLIVTALSLAGSCPLVERVCCPVWDERGLWLDMDLAYAGGAHITILTQINLMKLKERNINAGEIPINVTDGCETDSTCANNIRLQSKRAIYDSEVEDSAESSSDDETPPLQPVDSGESVTVPETANEPPGSSKKKFLRIVDKIATNKYFQTVTDYKYVKRAMEGLSNTDIKLQVEVQGLEGRLAVNLPTPPHDRLWIGFRTNPQLVLKARPTVGARTLRFAHISNWIEEKLTKEFEKVLVLPNMEDFIIDVMTPAPIDFE